MDFKLVLAAGLIGGAGGALGGLLVKLTKGAGDARKRVQLAIIPGVVAATLANPLHWDQTVADVIFPKTPREQVAETYGKQVAQDPAFTAYIRDKSDVSAATQQLTARGMKRLDVDDLRAAAAFRLQLARQSPRVCAGMWTGRADPKAIAEAMEAMSLPDLERFSRLTTRAALRELHGEGEPVAPPADPAATFAAAAGALGERGPELTRALQQGEAAPEAEGCKAAQLLLEAIGKLPDAQAREAFALATQ